MPSIFGSIHLLDLLLQNISPLPLIEIAFPACYDPGGFVLEYYLELGKIRRKRLMASALRKKSTDFVLCTLRFHQETPEMEALWKTLVRLSSSYIFVGNQQKKEKRDSRKKKGLEKRKTIPPPPGLTEGCLEETVGLEKSTVPTTTSISLSESSQQQILPVPPADHDRPTLTLSLIPTPPADVTEITPPQLAPVVVLQGSSSSSTQPVLSSSLASKKKRLTSDERMKQEGGNFVRKTDERLESKNKWKEEEEKPVVKEKEMEMRRKEMGLISWAEFESIEGNKSRKKKKKKKEK